MDEAALQRAQVKPLCKSLAEESLQTKEETDFLNLASGTHQNPDTVNKEEILG